MHHFPLNLYLDSYCFWYEILGQKNPLLQHILNISLERKLYHKMYCMLLRNYFAQTDLVSILSLNRANIEVHENIMAYSHEKGIRLWPRGVRLRWCGRHADLWLGGDAELSVGGAEEMLRRYKLSSNSTLAPRPRRGDKSLHHHHHPRLRSSSSVRAFLTRVNSDKNMPRKIYCSSRSATLGLCISRSHTQAITFLYDASPFLWTKCTFLHPHRLSAPRRSFILVPPALSVGTGYRNWDSHCFRESLSCSLT